MAIKINFTNDGNPEKPTLVLANRSGQKLGGINAKNITIKDCEKCELSFEVNKYVDGKLDPLWDKIRDFKLVHCVEWDMWFEIYVEVNEDNKTLKTVSCTQLGVAELSQLMLYGIEINTENDIAQEDYVATVLYNPDNKRGSLLDRLLSDKAPHYKILHVDSTIARIQRTFEFDGTSIYDALQEVAQEIHCLFIFHSDTDENGKIQRAISAYDLESNCQQCNYRGEFTDVCPECGSNNIDEGYGEDTTIFITADELAEKIQFTTDTDSVKNCFKLEGGDDTMTAAIRSCNPNGTDYIWYITDYMKEDMSAELVAKLDAYDKQYENYQKDYVYPVDATLLSNYNKLIEKYKAYKPELEQIGSPIKGFPALMTAYYNTVDFELYLHSTLMPDVSMSNTSATEQAKLLTSANLGNVAITNIKVVSLPTVENAVLGMAQVVVDARYQVRISQSEYSNKTWTGNFRLTNYTYDEDTAVSAVISVSITDDYATYVKQKIEKLIAKENIDDAGIVGLFKLEGNNFNNELKKYCLDSLISFTGACQSCLDILVEQGAGNPETWAESSLNLYNTMYTPYYNKLQALQKETSLRQSEIDTIIGTYDANGGLLKKGLQTNINEIKEKTQADLNFQNYIGKNLWTEFCTFRREDKYSNDNYISDGLDNAQLFQNAMEFIETAKNEIYKSAELQHSISADLYNLLAMDKFKPLVDHFEVWNWVRILIDGNVYKLRLVSYEIDYENISRINVEFSDVLKVKDGISDVKSVLDRMQDMATSYDSVKHQASQGTKGSIVVENWVEKGLDLTNIGIISGADGQTQTWDNHGMLFRKYDEFSQDYSPEQIKIINSTIAMTNDNWKTVKTAVGKFYYVDPIENTVKTGYGINAELVIGKLIMGEGLGIYNTNGTFKFDSNGFLVTDGQGNEKFKITPDGNITMNGASMGNVTINGATITLNATKNLIIKSGNLTLDANGNVNILGTVTATAGVIGGCKIVGGVLQVASANITSLSASKITTGIFKISKNGKEIFYADVDNGIVRIVADTFSLSNGDTIKSIADRSVNSLDSKLNQEEVFNRLTNKGSLKGIFMSGGQLYINATYIHTGIFKVAKNGKTTFSANVDTGAVSIIADTFSLSNGDTIQSIADKSASSAANSAMNSLNSKLTQQEIFNRLTNNGNLKGIFMSDGQLYINATYIHSGTLSANYIKGGTLTLGGASNGNGRLVILDGSNKEIGHWDNGGIVTKGTITATGGVIGGCPIVDGVLQVQSANIQSLSADKIKGGTITGVTISGNTITGNTISGGTISGATISGGTINGAQINSIADMYNAVSIAGGIINIISGGVSYQFGSVFEITDRSGISSFGPTSIHIGNDESDFGGNVNFNSRIYVSLASTFGSSMTIIDHLNVGSYITEDGTKLASKYEPKSSSDIRLKFNINNTRIAALPIINAIQLREFDWVNSNRHQKIGFIADELEKIDSELASGGGYNEDGSMNLKSVNTFYLVGYLTKAVQELYAMVQKLENK